MPSRESLVERYPGTEEVLVNLRDGFRRMGKVQEECAAAVGLKAHTSIVRMLAGDHPVPIHYIVVWRRWLGAPPGWPLLSWEGAERLFSRHG